TVSAGAQQQQPQQQPPPGCFTVEMSRSTQGNPQGSVLLDRCTGKTWLLLCIRKAVRFDGLPYRTRPSPPGGRSGADRRGERPPRPHALNRFALARKRFIAHF